MPLRNKIRYIYCLKCDKMFKTDNLFGKKFINCIECNSPLYVTPKVVTLKKDVLENLNFFHYCDEYVYHFTDRNNLESIAKWRYLQLALFAKQQNSHK